MEKGKSKSKENPVSQLMEIMSEIQVFQTPEGIAYGIIKIQNHEENWPLESDEFQGWLRSFYFRKFKVLPRPQEFHDLISLLKNNARLKTRNVHVRVAMEKDAITIDLCNKEWEAIKVTDSGWEIISAPGVLFRRTRGMKELPKPINTKEKGKVRRELEKFINTTPNSRTLIIGWLLGALNPEGPYSILILLGLHGSGKSTFVKMLKKLIDPTAAPLRTVPKTEHDLLIAAKNNWVLAFDNVSRITPDMSDALCRLSTGAGLSTRKLYKDYDEAIFDVRRPIIINGRTNMVTKSDLADRAMILTMKHIDKEKRKREIQLLREFEKKIPLFLGFFLNGLSWALRNSNRLELMELPRMADFVHFVAASKNSLFRKADAFVKAHEKNERIKSRRMINFDPVGKEIVKLLQNSHGQWSGTASDLLQALENGFSDSLKDRTIKDRSWPKLPNALSARINELAQAFREIGYEIDSDRSSREREISIKKVNSQEKPN